MIDLQSFLLGAYLSGVIISYAPFSSSDESELSLFAMLLASVFWFFSLPLGIYAAKLNKEHLEDNDGDDNMR